MPDLEEKRRKRKERRKKKKEKRRRRRRRRKKGIEEKGKCKNLVLGEDGVECAEGEHAQRQQRAVKANE